MGETVIRVENLSKKYLLRHEQAGQYKTLRDAIVSGASSLKQRLSGQSVRAKREEFWALKDVSFEVKQGEVVGIIGRNGAGKSTLLKILSRITEPTAGRVSIRGRVASLLEVGTGFHPELTGRENIFLNGAILGMSRVEINRKFDEIVAFAEVEKFLDTPVKHYSSGMYVRLAFAVAAHLEPEILIIDEVLAVGDASFQKKCLGKMEEVGKDGRTVIFVSHQMDMIHALCDRCILLDKGSVMLSSYPEEVTEIYLNSSIIGSQARFKIEEDENLALQIISGKVLNSNNQNKDRFDVFEQIIIEIEYIVRKTRAGAIVNFELKRNATSLFFSFDTDCSPDLLHSRQEGAYISRVKLPCPLLKSGFYSLTLGTGVANVGKIQHLENILAFNVELISQPSSLLSYAETRPGLIAVPLTWKTQTRLKNSEVFV
ncbi:MAG: ATP-binding cassette domain-containing protein [Leptolyngbyaceae cyanobacterium RM1_1_2]|nr:ATP-binding cassette domain-containing protein [Leptolyngbyaceae cyanobacterium RM1_1_2]